MWIDSHCHLEGEEFTDDRDAVLQRAREADVDTLVAIGGGAAPGTLRCGLDFAAAHDSSRLRIWATVGVHPHEAAKASLASWEEIAILCADRRVVAVGEIGLDYYYDRSPRAIQIAAFERQLAIAEESGLPVSVHCRDAFDDCFAAIAAANPTARGVFHCFTGGPAEAARVLDLGWYLSFSGMLTFPKLEPLRQIAATAPEDRILIETDAPYLAPVPHRGKRNEPAYVAVTAARLAELRGMTPESLAATTRRNFHRLFARTG